MTKKKKFNNIDGRSRSPQHHAHSHQQPQQQPLPPQQQVNILPPQVPSLQAGAVRLPDMSLPPPLFPPPIHFPVTLPATVPTHHAPAFPPAAGPYPLPMIQQPRWDPMRDSEGFVKDPLAAFEAMMKQKDRRHKRSRSRSPPPHYQRRYSPQRVYR